MSVSVNSDYDFVVFTQLEHTSKHTYKLRYVFDLEQYSSHIHTYIINLCMQYALTFLLVHGHTNVIGIIIPLVRFHKAAVSHCNCFQKFLISLHKRHEHLLIKRKQRNI